MTGLQSIKSYLVEDVVVLFHGEGADDPALVQEVAVDLCAVKGTVADLNLNEVSDPTKMKCLVLRLMVSKLYGVWSRHFSPLRPSPKKG